MQGCYKRLPQSLEQALDAFTTNDSVGKWFPDGGFVDLYLKHKQAEIAMISELDNEAKCLRYEEVY